MSTPLEGNYLFINYGYHGDPLVPQLALWKEGASEFEYMAPRGKQLTLAFDTTERFCTGWHNLATSESSPCPDGAIVAGKYDVCSHCQQKTGFNPAFYHAKTVSPQQQKRNAEPHFLYLAHFGHGVLKVGISWSARGIKRLLDQGARSWLRLGNYPTAHEARMFEAQIARLPGIAETIPVRKKVALLQQPYNAEQGANELRAASEHLGRMGEFPPEEPIHLDAFYFDNAALQPRTLVDLSQGSSISGTCLGMNGSILVAEQDGMQFMLPLSKLTGYRVKISSTLAPNAHAPQQIALL